MPDQVCVLAICVCQVFDIPFNSANKWSLAVTSCPGDSNHQLVMMKGAPEIVLTKCSHHLHNRQEKEIDEVSECDGGGLSFQILVHCICVR
jgi:magnesium-transporting ATPase (P-type)